MLYVTTRVKQDAFTANRALSESRGPEGGFFLPMCLPKSDDKQIRELGEKSFSRNMADVINLFFNTELDSWALEFAIGRYPVKLVKLGSKTILAQTWHNPQWRFERLVVGVEKAIRQSDQINRVPSDWLMIASRIAVLFGIFGQLRQKSAVSAAQKLDISLPEAEEILWTAASPGACMPCVHELLSCLQQRGIRSGVISNIGWSGAALTRRLNRLLPENHFEFVIASSEYGLRKPDRFLFDLALQKAGLSPDDVWYCGDNLHADVCGAHGAGIFPVLYECAVPDGRTASNAGVPADFPYLHIHGWPELMAMLETL